MHLDQGPPQAASVNPCSTVGPRRPSTRTIESLPCGFRSSTSCSTTGNRSSAILPLGHDARLRLHTRLPNARPFRRGQSSLKERLTESGHSLRIHVCQGTATGLDTSAVGAGPPSPTRAATFCVEGFREIAPAAPLRLLCRLSKRPLLQPLTCHDAEPWSHRHVDLSQVSRTKKRTSAARAVRLRDNALAPTGANCGTQGVCTTLEALGPQMTAISLRASRQRFESRRGGPSDQRHHEGVITHIRANMDKTRCRWEKEPVKTRPPRSRNVQKPEQPRCFDGCPIDGTTICGYGGQYPQEPDPRPGATIAARPFHHATVQPQGNQHAQSPKEPTRLAGTPRAPFNETLLLTVQSISSQACIGSESTLIHTAATAQSAAAALRN